MRKCKVCEMESSYLDEVAVYDVNGHSYTDALDIERNAQNPDALAHDLCTECAETFEFNESNGGVVVDYRKHTVYLPEGTYAVSRGGQIIGFVTAADVAEAGVVAEKVYGHFNGISSAVLSVDARRSTDGNVK